MCELSTLLTDVVRPIFANSTLQALPLTTPHGALSRHGRKLPSARDRYAMSDSDGDEGGGAARHPLNRVIEAAAARKRAQKAATKAAVAADGLKFSVGLDGGWA